MCLSNMRPFFAWLKSHFQTFLLLPEYVKAIIKKWVNILFGETVAAVAFLIWWALANPKNPPLIVIFVVAMFVAGYYAWQGDHVRLKPKIKAQGTHQTPTPVERDTGFFANRVFSQIVMTCLTEAPVYECEGWLQRVQRFTGRHWEETDLDKNLILRWSNEKERKIVQHPGAEKMLNVFFVQDIPQLMIVPCVNQDTDIPVAKLNSIFMRSPAGTVTAFRFHVQITCSDRVDGKLISIAPECCVLEATFGDDPLRPTLTLSPTA